MTQLEAVAIALVVLLAAVATVMGISILGLRRTQQIRTRTAGRTPDASGPPTIIYLGIPLIAFALIPLVLASIRGGGFETTLPLLLAGGVVLLLLSLAATAVVYKELGLVDAKEALGLPQGSVRAVIALALILIFAIMAIYIYSRQSFPTSVEVDNLTQQQVDAIPPQDRVLVVPIPAPVGAPSDGTEAARFRVRVNIPQTQAGEDIGKQLITTVSTLVVAISAFYFGSNSVMAAQSALSGGLMQHVIIAGDAVRRPKKRNGTWEPVEITVLTVPKGLALRETVEGDDASTLTRRDDEVYVYTPSAKAKEKVTLRFGLAVRPETFEEVVVELKSDQTTDDGAGGETTGVRPPETGPQPRTTPEGQSAGWILVEDAPAPPDSAKVDTPATKPPEQTSEQGSQEGA